MILAHTDNPKHVSHMRERIGLNHTHVRTTLLENARYSEIIAVISSPRSFLSAPRAAAVNLLESGRESGIEVQRVKRSNGPQTLSSHSKYLIKRDGSPSSNTGRARLFSEGMPTRLIPHRSTSPKNDRNWRAVAAPDLVSTAPVLYDYRTLTSKECILYRRWIHTRRSTHSRRPGGTAAVELTSC